MLAHLNSLLQGSPEILPAHFCFRITGLNSFAFDGLQGNRQCSKYYNEPAVKTTQYMASYSGICLVSEERISEKQAISLLNKLLFWLCFQVST